MEKFIEVFCGENDICDYMKDVTEYGIICTCPIFHYIVKLNYPYETCKIFKLNKEKI